jgi:hypothetical protein
VNIFIDESGLFVNSAMRESWNVVVALPRSQMWRVVNTTGEQETRAVVMQRKTQRPVQFEITLATREAVQ